MYYLWSNEEKYLYWATSRENKQPTTIGSSENISVVSGVPYDWFIGPTLFTTGISLTYILNEYLPFYTGSYHNDAFLLINMFCSFNVFLHKILKIRWVVVLLWMKLFRLPVARVSKLHNALGFQSRVRGFETYSGYIYFQMRSRLTCVSSFSQNEKKSNKYWQSRKNTKRKIICKLGLRRVY